jgi:hypothetical protein
VDIIILNNIVESKQFFSSFIAVQAMANSASFDLAGCIRQFLHINETSIESDRASLGLLVLNILVSKFDCFAERQNSHN